MNAVQKKSREEVINLKSFEDCEHTFNNGPVTEE